jgi:hypothetical protein
MDQSEDNSLCSLFTDTAYKEQSFSIPSFGIDGSAVIKQTILGLSTSATDYDLTGQVIWPVSILLSCYIASSQGKQNMNNIHIWFGSCLFVISSFRSLVRSFYSLLPR